MKLTTSLLPYLARHGRSLSVLSAAAGTWGDGSGNVLNERLNHTDAQAKLRSSSVLVVGAGALGCGCLPYLVRAGVGQITVCDGDTVELSNLHRQILFHELDIGRNKAEVAAERLRLSNSGVDIMAVPQHCGYDKQTIMRVKSHDIIADCSDNVGTRYFLNDACLLAGKILVVAAALGTEGSLTRWNYSSGPCYRCVSPAPSHHESHRQCADDGVLGPVPGAHFS